MNKEVQKIVFLAFLLSVWSPLAAGYEITFDWSGQVERVFEWQQGALPSKINVGDRVEGSYRFQAFDFDSESYRLGTFGAGNRYTYSEDFLQTITINDLSWVLDVGTVTLFNTNRTEFLERSQSIDFLSTDADDENILSYPNLFSDRGIGVGFFDAVPEFDLFSTINILSTRFDDSEFTGGGGYITSRERNDEGDIVDGYYIDLDIDELAISIDSSIVLPPVIFPVPLPGSLWLLCFGMFALLGTRRMT